jgi:hypothetical protein
VRLRVCVCVFNTYFVCVNATLCVCACCVLCAYCMYCVKKQTSRMDTMTSRCLRVCVHACVCGGGN